MRFGSALAAALGAMAVGAGVVAALAGEEEAKKPAAEKSDAAAPARLVAALKKSKISLVEACQAAEKALGGKAVEAELEAEDDDDDGVEYEVVVALTDGDKVTLREVDVDGTTGKLLAEDDDGEDGDDEEDDDGDDKDDAKK